jgi:hypothetical protein
MKTRFLTPSSLNEGPRTDFFDEYQVAALSMPVRRPM